MLRSEADGPARVGVVIGPQVVELDQAVAVGVERLHQRGWMAGHQLLHLERTGAVAVLAGQELEGGI